MKKFIFVLGLFLTNSCFAAFTDVPEDHSNFEAILWAQKQNMIKGFEDGTFRPDKKINRAEFLKIVMSVETLHATSLRGENCFTDVQDQWYAPYVCTAKEKNIISGYPDNTFRPEQNISFVEAAKIILRVHKPEIKANPDTWYQNYVAYLTENKYIPNSVRQYGQQITRGETVELLYRVQENITDKKSIEFLPSEYARDEEHGYYEGEEVIGSDGQTFAYLGDRYAVDDKQVYFVGKMIEGADRESFKIDEQENDYSQDKENKFYKGQRVYYDQFYINNKNLYILRSKEAYLVSLCEKNFSLNVKNIKFLGKNLVKDENYVYFLSPYKQCLEILKNADVETFSAIKNDSQTFKDKRFVYYLESMQSSSTSSQIIFNNLKIIEEADSQTFIKIDNSFFRDKNFIYYISSTHSASGALVSRSMVKNKYIEPDSFEILNHYFARDKNHVYCINYNKKKTLSHLEILPESDRNTFIIFPKTNLGKDKNNYFRNIYDYHTGSSCNIFTSVNKKSFEILNSHYAKDKNHVYKDGEILEGADPATFKVPEN